jgi:acetyl esterase/lipase
VKNKKQIVQFVLLVFIILVMASNASHQSGLAEEKAYIVEQDIVYGMGGDIELKLDLYRPVKVKGRLPTIIFIHGGWWQLSNRASVWGYREAAERGYVAVTIDYRLTKTLNEHGEPKYQFPAQVHDVKCAVRWLRANARKYKIDPNKIGVLGISSGGHLALMLGLTDSTDGLEGECGNMKYSTQVQAVVSVMGNTELTEYYYETIDKRFIVKFLGGTPKEVPEQYKAASPLTYVSKDDPPVLTIHGDMDLYIPVKQAKLLDKKMNEVGASHTLIVLANVGHMAGIANLFSDNPIWHFFDEHLKRK